jgi:rubredoxin
MFRTGSGVSLFTVGPSGETPSMGERPACSLCGRATYDPKKQDVPWVRGVSGGRQVLICPECQRDRKDWAGHLDRCESCGGTRLSAILGDVVCRACGHTMPADAGA